MNKVSCSGELKIFSISYLKFCSFVSTFDTVMSWFEFAFSPFHPHRTINFNFAWKEKVLRQSFALLEK